MVWVTMGTAPTPASPQQAGGVAASEPRFKVIRAVSGSKGAAQGSQYIIEDPRTVFYVPDDKQVIVYFEWEGPLGPHRFEGLWKNPEGKVSVISDFSYSAEYKRFGGYWSLILSETMPTGIWTLEARVDGEAAGAHSFQILAAPRPPGSELPVSKAHLPPAEIYKRAIAASVAIEGLDLAGERVTEGTGFFANDGVVVTSFQAIDGAHRIRVILSDGRRVETDQVMGWNRWQDWVVLQVAANGAPTLPRAAAKPVVGDRVYSLDVPSPGTRIILDLDVIGINTFDRAGERLNVTNTVSSAAIGAPLLNVYGEVVGIMGTTLLPGANSLLSGRFNYINLSLLTSVRGGLAAPIESVSLRGSRVASLADLHAAGQMISPLKPQQEVLNGIFSRAVHISGGFPQTIENKSEFSARDKECAFSVVVRGTSKTKSVVAIHLYDADNRRLAFSKSIKVNFKLGSMHTFDWKVPLAQLQPGYYRVDFVIDAVPAWRGFLQVVS
jgi:hypothetical protein